MCTRNVRGRPLLATRATQIEIETERERAEWRLSEQGRGIRMER